MRTRTTPGYCRLISLMCLVILLGLAIKLNMPSAKASSAPSKPAPAHSLLSVQADGARQVSPQASAGLAPSGQSAPLCGPNWIVSQSTNVGTSNNYLSG